MSILIRPPNKVNKKKKQSKTAKEILQRLQDFLNAESKEPAEILYSFWGDQQNAITYKELRELVQNGDLTQEQWQEWQQDYSKLVASKLDQMWQKAMEAGISGQPIFDNFESFELDMKSPGVVSWIKERGAAFVTASTDEQKKAIQSLLAKKVVEKYTVDELARIIRPCIGLTKQDSEAVMRQYDTLKKNLREQHPRMKAESIQRKALDAAQKYAERKHRQRAMTIAQTELAFAYNRGADQGVRQAQEQGLLGKTIKRWITSGDDSVCSTCEALDGTEIEMDDNFNFGGRLLFVGHKMLPPAHPRCGCAVEYIEVEPPTFEPSIDTDEEESTEEQPEEYQRLRDEYDKSQYKTEKRSSKKMKKFSDIVSVPKARESPVQKKKQTFKIAKSDDEKMLAFGWANISIRSDGEVIEDWQEDIIEPADLENAAYEFVRLYREGGEMHERGGVATLVESVVFTEEKCKAIGIPEGTLPVGWWIGFKVLDKDVWEKVKDGTYSMFSIEGEAERKEVKDDESND